MKDILRSFLWYLVRRKPLSILQLLGISSFGVAAVIGMTLASRSALESMDNTADFLRGGTSHAIARPAGSMQKNS